MTNDEDFEEKLDFDELFSFKNLDTISCIDYTFDVIEAIFLADENEKKTSTELLIEYVDRGIHNWIEFADNISTEYPRLNLLFVSQNYSLYDRNRMSSLADEDAASYNQR